MNSYMSYFKGWAVLAVFLLFLAPNALARNLYVANSDDDSVSVIDTATNQVFKEIPVGDDPRGLASSPDGRYIYVPNRSSYYSDPEFSVSVIATSSNTVITTIEDDSFYEPYYIAFTPDGSEAWVVNKNGADSDEGSVTIIDTSSHTVDDGITDDCFSSPEAIAMNPVSSRAYVVNKGADTVCVVNTSTRAVVTSISVGTDPKGIVVTPDGAYVYIANTYPDDTVSKIRTSDNFVVQTLSLPNSSYPRGMDITPDGGTIYVGHCDGDTDISVIDRSDPDNDTVSQISFSGSSDYFCDVVLVPELDRLYVTDQWGYEVKVLDTTNDTEVTGTGYPISLNGDSPRFIVAQEIAPTRAIPTLAGWGMIILMTLVGLTVIFTFRRRKSPTEVS
jgi:YVTN family beta-propeller protein